MSGPRGPSRWNPYCYSPGPLGNNDVADPNCHDITDAGNPAYYSPWEGIYNRRDELIGVKRHCLAADREYTLHYRRSGDILDYAGNGNPGIWINVETTNPSGEQVTIQTDAKKAAQALQYIRQKIDANLPASVGVNVAGQNSGNINGALVDHWLAVDGYRVDEHDAVIQLFATDNAAGAGASPSSTPDNAGYRIKFEVKADGSIIKPAIAGVTAANLHAHPDIEVEYQIAVVQVYVKDIKKGKDDVLEVNGIPLEIWGGGQRKPFKPNRKRLFKQKDWEALKKPKASSK